MKLSNAGLMMIESFEGLILEAYKDAGGTWSIGYGHTGKIDGMAICSGMKITQSKAQELLAEDCYCAETEVNRYNSTYNFNQNQYDALVSFAFNIGNLKQITQSGTRTCNQISEHMPEYNHCACKVCAGLTQRRRKEQLLFNTDAPSTTNKTNEEVAKEVIAGKWGNGNNRRVKLAAYGYDYATIQALVNKLLK